MSDEPVVDSSTISEVAVKPEVVLSTQRQRLIEAGTELCPWCDGNGVRWRTSWDQVPCGPCKETGEASRWQGPVAEDWRRRTAIPFVEPVPLETAR